MMKLIPCDRNEIRGGYSRTKNQEILEEFRGSGADCALVEGWTTKDANGAAASLNISIKRFKFGDIKAVSRAGKVYLIKTT
jgi:hypothetical protein